MADDYKKVNSTDHYAWFKYSLVAALAFGLQNYLLGDITTEYGFAGVFPLFLGYVPLWIVYRFKVHNLDFYAEKPSRLWGVLFRGLIQTVIFACLALCFTYAEKVNINKGVIASLFTSTIMFTSIIFRFVYGEEISFKQAFVMLMITAGVVCVGVGKPSSGG
jgi:drug/metabolite transporter (DMT)-like permease